MPSDNPRPIQSRLGVEAITGKPYKPTTQGKNERFHQTLFRWLDKQPLAASLVELQAQVDEFDRIYNNERPHQALPPSSSLLVTEMATATIFRSLHLISTSMGIAAAVFPGLTLTSTPFVIAISSLRGR